MAVGNISHILCTHLEFYHISSIILRLSLPAARQSLQNLCNVKLYERYVLFDEEHPGMQLSLHSQGQGFPPPTVLQSRRLVSRACGYHGRVSSTTASPLPSTDTWRENLQPIVDVCKFHTYQPSVMINHRISEDVNML